METEKAFNNTARNKAIVRRFNKELIENGNVQVIDELVAPGFTHHTAGGRVSKGKDGLVQFIQWLHGGFSGFQILIHDQWPKEIWLPAERRYMLPIAVRSWGMPLRAKPWRFK